MIGNWINLYIINVFNISIISIATPLSVHLCRNPSLKWMYYHSLWVFGTYTKYTLNILISLVSHSPLGFGVLDLFLFPGDLSLCFLLPILYFAICICPTEVRDFIWYLSLCISFISLNTIFFRNVYSSTNVAIYLAYYTMYKY